MKHLLIDSPLGSLTLAATEYGLAGVWFAEHRHPPKQGILGERVEPGDDAVLDEAATQLTDYLAGNRVDFDLPLDPSGTEFQRAVWTRLRAILRGQVTTYATVATDIGRPRANQAVGQAVGHNPLSIVVPCHRVIGTDGSITGYAGGLPAKEYLLELEGYRTRP
ncbi:MAG: methylated-DNA--[protein]-cysteine S-methyltransferase [Galactobacter sp.]|uniref:methylated-DNA--[protein]-cysteine S-methyltransferase n=1 Tax=Galactobacter sp. TaxID=2676125 RepID=UPI0025C0C138|nr:methylated-DNA--[protein]-cysteine S-methyltransferase [Galactobacter sp.]